MPKQNSFYWRTIIWATIMRQPVASSLALSLGFLHCIGLCSPSSRTSKFGLFTFFRQSLTRQWNNGFCIHLRALDYERWVSTLWTLFFFHLVKSRKTLWFLPSRKIPRYDGAYAHTYKAFALRILENKSCCFRRFNEVFLCLIVDAESTLVNCNLHCFLLLISFCCEYSLVRYALCDD